MRERGDCHITFITGTGTGVGKTVLTALLLEHLRTRNRKIVAIKPFCSGSLNDGRLLWRVQAPDLTLSEVTPFFFTKPVAPLASPRPGGTVSLAKARKAIAVVARRADCLLVEGAGGLMVPLGPNYKVEDLILALRCERVVIVAPNRLGTINHTLLTVSRLRQLGVPERALRVILMEPKRRDASARSNARLIRQFAPNIPLLRLPYLGPSASTLKGVKENCKKVQKTLAHIFR